MGDDMMMTIRLTADLKEKLGRLAENTRRPQSYLATEALEAYVNHELQIIEAIKRGLADMEAGRVTPHEEVMARADQIIAEARQKRAARL